MSMRTIRKRGQRLVAARRCIDWRAVRVAIERLADLLAPPDLPA